MTDADDPKVRARVVIEIREPITNADLRRFVSNVEGETWFDYTMRAERAGAVKKASEREGR